MKTSKLIVKGSEISFFNINTEDYISLTDIAKHKDATNTDDIIKNWLRNRNTIELLGFWEQLYNPNFKPVEFDGFRKQAGMNSFVIK
jgi:KilA-N domain